MSADFDIAAATYDTDFTFSMIGNSQRKRVYAFFDKVLENRSGLKILELNCGTGEDANLLAKKGNTVVATDISDEMLDVAKTKEFAQDITFLKQDLRDLDLPNLDRDFDIVFSNFGGMNCIDKSSITNLGKSVSQLLKPNGKFIVVIMPKICLVESLYFILKGNRAKALRRKKGFALVNVSGKEVKTWYYSPKDLVSLLADHFKSEAIKPVGLFIPPSYLESFFQKHPKLLRFINLLEKIFANFSWQARYSDHYYAQYRLK